MKNRLFIFCGFAHDTQRILAAIGNLTFVVVEGGFNCQLRISLELRTAPLAYAKTLFNDSQIAFRHTRSLAQSASREECL